MSRTGFSVLLAATLFGPLLFSAPTALGQSETPEPADPWAPLRQLVGTWEGSIDGVLGTGTAIRDYEFILDGKYLRMRHASVRLPQEKSPRGDYHRELSIFSYDRERETIVYRQFAVEGFVNRYTCDVEAMKLVCTAESVENGSGFQARLTIEIRNPYEFAEIFELASPGQELSVYFTNTWKRKPELGDLDAAIFQ